MPVTHKTQLKLTPKQRTMFEGQRKKAQGLMEKEDKEGRGSGKAYAAAKRAYERAGRLLYGDPKGKPKKTDKVFSPGKKRSKKKVYADRRKPFEKATGTDAIKAALEAAAKRALKGDEG